MRYWAYFAAKLIIAGGILYGSLGLLNPLAPPDPDASATRPNPSAKAQHGPPVLKIYPEHPKVAPENSGLTSRQGKIGDAEPDTEIQVELAPPSPQNNDNKKAADQEALDKEAKKLAPLDYGGQYLALNLALMVWFLFGAGMLYLIVYDQRYRCRVCLRRLRMPVETGSRGFMLQLGRPRTEYICPYGHGTLKQEEFQTSGLENPEWTAHSGDMWDELYAASKQDRDEQ
jgi:hypothetical protein